MAADPAMIDARIRELCEAQRDDEPAPPSSLRFVRVDELLAQPAPPWRVLRVIPARGLIVIYGASGSGKTFGALDLAASVCRGIAWAGRRTRRAAVAYVAAEGQLRDRIAAYLLHHGLGTHELEGLRVLDAAVNLLDPGADLEPMLHGLRSMAGDVGEIGLVVVDTLNRVMPGGDENSSEDMGMLVAAAGTIERELGCAVVLIHHSGKDDARGARGHSSLRAACDAEISVRRDGDVRTVTAEKVRDGADGETLMTFRLRAVDLGPMTDVDEDADPDERRSSCVVEPTGDLQQHAGTGRLSDVDRIALQALRELAEGTEERTAQTSLHPAGRPVVAIDQWRERFRRARGIDKADETAMDSSKKAFQRAVDRLTSRRIVGVHEARAWLW